MMTNLETSINDGFDGQLVELLYSIDAREDVKNLHVGIVHSSNDSHDTSGVEHRTARLMEETAPSDVSWSRLFLGGEVEGVYGTNIRFSEADRRHFELNGISAGGFLSKLVYDKLPIEWSTEGESKVRLTFAVDNDYILNLTGEGSFDTAYMYDHEAADMDEDEPSGSEIIYEMSFTADLLYCPAIDPVE